MNKPYPVGTKIKYTGCCPKCKGKAGEVIYVSSYSCRVTLPKSKCSSLRTFGNLMVSWNDVELISQKGRQLEFAFMD